MNRSQHRIKMAAFLAGILAGSVIDRDTSSQNWRVTQSDEHRRECLARAQAKRDRKLNRSRCQTD